MFSFTKKVLCIHSLSLIQITTKKKVYFFLLTIRKSKSFSCVQFTAIDSLF